MHVLHSDDFYLFTTVIFHHLSPIGIYVGKAIQVGEWETLPPAILRALALSIFLSLMKHNWDISHMLYNGNHLESVPIYRNSKAFKNFINLFVVII